MVFHSNCLTNAKILNYFGFLRKLSESPLINLIKNFHFYIKNENFSMIRSIIYIKLYNSFNVFQTQVVLTIIKSINIENIFSIK